ncbi:hypothetical protein CHUAL_009373 [Chamberlinius hualienensis]
MNAAFLLKAVPSRISTSTRFLLQYLSNHRIMTDSKPSVVFVLGGPGAGKGTVCSRIVDDLKYAHLSAGDLLRQERAREGSEYGTIIEEYIKQGKIVPVEVTCKLLENAMQASDSNKFLIDGFPRNEDNLQGWEKEMSDKTNLKFVLFLDCPDDICCKRCLGRGLAGSGRTDDNEESLKRRLETYRNETMPIIDYYQKRNLVRTVDASQVPDKVYEDVRHVFQDGAN